MPAAVGDAGTAAPALGYMLACGIAKSGGRDFYDAR